MDSPQQPEPTDQATPEPAVAVPEPETQAISWATYAEVPYQDPDATPPYGTPAPKPRRPADPFAVAVGNASLLGVGYFLLGRWILGVLAVLGTVLLVLFHLFDWPTLWFEFVILGWWVAVVAHGYLLARPHPRARPARRQWVVALAVALPVLLAFGFLRFDAADVDEDAAAGRANGDCAEALAATDRLWFGNRLANAPLAERADDTVAACDRLGNAGRQLETGLDGDTEALEDGFDGLDGVLTDLPGHQEMVRSTVNRFLDGLPTGDPCRTTAITDWLADRKPGGVLRAASDVVPDVAPTAIVECADGFMAAADWQNGRRYYQQLVDEYPDHELAPKAQQGITKATRAIELANVRDLLTTPGTGGLPAYCSTPAAYSGAKPYRPGKPNRSLLYGNTAQTNKIPAGWRAKDAADAVVVICAEASYHGAAVQTCPYVPDSRPGYVTNVTFHKIAIPVKLYELRTGKLVRKLTLQINGTSCPDVIEYSSYGIDTGPPPRMYVSAPVANVRAAFRPLMVG
ncbi:tol-pal system YbgF family protein [Actinophytocola sp. NPDC049390]|uniref:tol-pal system YbgF family protein n=1 Tax=Actinophytocola sp. NPDC049390 TaxID=3363894 RepID=UPI0037A6B61C